MRVGRTFAAAESFWTSKAPLGSARKCQSPSSEIVAHRAEAQKRHAASRHKRSKYRRMVFTSIRESCKSKLPASGNATWMQGSVKVPGGQVYALLAK